MVVLAFLRWADLSRRRTRVRSVSRDYQDSTDDTLVSLQCTEVPEIDDNTSLLSTFMQSVRALITMVYSV